MRIRIKYIIRMVVLVTTIFFISQKLLAGEFYKNQQGIWVVRHNLISKVKIDDLIKKLKIIQPQNVYLQVRGRGYSYYNSNIEPISPTIDPNFDPLQYFINNTDSLNFKVHAWVNTYLLWTSPDDPTNNNHLYFKHPEWFEYTLKPTKSKKTRNIYLSPHLPEVRRYIISIIDDLITKYDLDGIHLDYIRYDNKYYGFHDKGINEFWSVYKQPDNSKWKLINNDNWKSFKASKVDFLLEDIHNLKIKKCPNLILSAAVKPNPEKAYSDFGQNWENWLKQGLIDNVVIMNYTTDNNIFTQNLSLIQKKCENSQVFIGLGLWNKKENQIVQQIEISKVKNFNNIVLFSYDTIIEKYLR